MLTLTEFRPARMKAGAQAAEDAVVGGDVGAGVGGGGAVTGGSVAGGLVTGGAVGAGVATGGWVAGGACVTCPRTVERDPPPAESVDPAVTGSGTRSEDAVVGSVVVSGTVVTSAVVTAAVVCVEDVEPAGRPIVVVDGSARPGLLASFDLAPRLSVMTRTAWKTTVVATTVPTSQSTISSPRLRT